MLSMFILILGICAVFMSTIIGCAACMISARMSRHDVAWENGFRTGLRTETPSFGHEPVSGLATP